MTTYVATGMDSEGKAWAQENHTPKAIEVESEGDNIFPYKRCEEIRCKVLGLRI